MSKSLKVWLASKKFSMLIAFWIFDFVGAFFLYPKAPDFPALLELFSEAMTNALWAYGIFAGVEGGLDAINRYSDRGDKGGGVLPIPPNVNVS